MVAYHVEEACFENVVFGIEGVPAAKVIGDGASFAERSRMYGWLRDWNPAKETAKQFLTQLGLRVFALECRYGMTAWVAAISMEQVTVT